MRGKTRDYSRAILNLLRATDVSPVTPYVGLMSIAPSADTDPGTECSYVGYARQGATFAAPIDYLESNGKQIMTTSADIEFPAVPADEDIEAVAIFDAASAGNMLYYASLVDTIPSGETPRFLAGNLGIAED